ncbi:hypothetical protein AAZX31_02G158600 [Glycine max]
MDNENAKDKIFEKFTWRIRNFSTLDSKPLYSEEFFLDNHTWSILIYPKGNKVAYLSIYLDAGDPDDLPHGRRKYANFKLALVNQVHDKYNDIEETSHVFSASETNWGFTTFTPLNKLCDPSLGFIVNDTCIIQVQILANKSKHEMISTSFGGLVDFRGLGKLEEDFVPLLEEVCSRYPSLIDSMQKRSQRFIEWAFTALGRVLHFLKNKKIKDMDIDACNHLQILWDELLEQFRFDLIWLELHV